MRSSRGERERFIVVREEIEDFWVEVGSCDGELLIELERRVCWCTVLHFSVTVHVWYGTVHPQRVVKPG
jgi:hypothetical protein